MTPYFCFPPYVSLFAELDEKLDKLNQGPSVAQQQQRATDTMDTSGEETETSQPRRRVRSKRTFKMKKSYATSELARFFVTGPTDASTKLSEFYCRLCRKDVSVLTYGSPEVLRHFQGIRHFAGDQRLRLETPGWFWWRAFNREWAGEAAEQDFVGSLSCSGERLPVPWRFDSGCFRKLWPSTSRARQGFVPRRWLQLGEVTSWLSVCGSGFSWQPVESMSALPGHAMKFWLVPCVPRNNCVGSLSHICSFICFSQSFWMECSQGFWLDLSSGWRRTSSLGWNLRTVVPALGCLWGRCGGTVSTVWLWGWSIAIMAMLAANWSSLGKFCVRLVVGHLWCHFLGGYTPLLEATRSIWEAGVCAEC